MYFLIEVVFAYVWSRTGSLAFTSVLRVAVFSWLTSQLLMPDAHTAARNIATAFACVFWLAYVILGLTALFKGNWEGLESAAKTLTAGEDTESLNGTP